MRVASARMVGRCSVRQAAPIAASAAGSVSAVHDVSDGGALVAVAEMALAGNAGAMLTLPNVANPAAVLFGEDQGRYILALTDAGPLLEAAREAGIPAALLGHSGGGGALVLAGERSISVGMLRDAHEATLPALMAEA